jgi:hypothetical protein
MGHEFWYMHRHACSQRPALRLPGPAAACGQRPGAGQRLAATVQVVRQRPTLRLPGPVSGMQPAASGQGMRQTLRKNSQGKNAKTCQKYMYFSKKTD